MIYLDLFSALQRHHVDYVLIGGLAISIHGIERATMDIDVTVAMTAENLSALVSMANQLGMQPVLPVPLEALKDTALLDVWHRERNMQAFALQMPGRAGLTLDILIRPPVDFQQLKQNAVIFDVADVPVIVASIDDLIAMKRAAGRPIDLADVEHLMRLKGSLQ